MLMFLDTETTGLFSGGRAPHITDAGYVLYSPGCYAERHEWSSLIKPPVHIPERISAITGITDDTVAAAPVFADIALHLRQQIEAADMVIAHNACFDLGVLDAGYARAGVRPPRWPAVTDTAEQFSYVGYLPSLQFLADTFLHDAVTEEHRALPDARLLLRVCEASGLLKELCHAVGR